MFLWTVEILFVAIFCSTTFSSISPKTFKTNLGKTPYEIFDEFNANSVNAASIGQVLAVKNNKKLAVKIQYPGISDSISSDLSLVKPMAIQNV
jgi:predicted unusual protein kinase regulating ubiquinone biosynthesis (AarF/ABC1/UbiB family)